MIKTVWLALIFLTGLGAMVAIKMGTAPLASAGALQVEPRVQTYVETDTTLTKADKLEVSYVEPVAPDKAVVTPVAILPPKTASKPAEKITKIVSRHWHDPLAPKTSRVPDRSATKPLSKSATR
jgi:hypothetical protein